MLKNMYINQLLEKHIGYVQRYTELKLSASEIQGSRLQEVFRSIYPLMPDSLVIQTTEDQFVSFCMENIDKILPASSLS